MSLNQVQMIPVKSLVKHNKNPRTITKDDFENLKKRMQKDPKFFEMRPLLVSSDPSTNICTIYAGNQRFEAAKSLKYKEVPCIMEYDVPADLQRERMVADNLHHGAWNIDVLANEFDDLNLVEMGFDLSIGEEKEGQNAETDKEDNLEIMVTFKLKMPNEKSASFENQLDELLVKFPEVIKEKSI